MILRNTYLAFGPEASPRVTTISPDQAKFIEQAEALGRRKESDAFRDGAYSKVFGKGVTYMLPAWDVDCMTLIATQYSGVWKVEVCGLAAKLALGRPLNAEAPVAVASTKVTKRGAGGRGVRVLAGPQPLPPSGTTAQQGA